MAKHNAHRYQKPLKVWGTSNINFDYNDTNLEKSGKCGIIMYVSNWLTSFQICVSDSIFKEQLWIRFDLLRRQILY